jgi:hypothetical protein
MTIMAMKTFGPRTYTCATEGGYKGGCGKNAHVVKLEKRVKTLEATVKKQAQEKGPSKKELAAKASRQRQLDAQGARFDRNSAAIRRDLDTEMARTQGRTSQVQTGQSVERQRLLARQNQLIRELAASGHLSKAEKAAYNATLPKNSWIRLK